MHELARRGDLALHEDGTLYRLERAEDDCEWINLGHIARCDPPDGCWRDYLMLMEVWKEFRRPRPRRHDAARAAYYGGLAR